MASRLRIYVAGPYSAAEPSIREANTRRAVEAGIEVLRKGHIPYIPHLTHYVDLHAQANGLNITWDEYVAWDMAWLELCDALLYLGSSRGADLELAKARELGKQVFHSIDDVPAIGSQLSASA